MRSFTGLAGSLLASAALFAGLARADASTVDPIVIKGKHFFYNTNHTQFFFRGVAYQQNYIANGSVATNEDYTDPLADADACARDIPYLVQLRTNVIRTYAINPTADHSACMNALADAGIYVISDLSAPSQSINRNDPAWTVDLFQRYTAVIQELSQYNNVIGFFAGNEVSDSTNTTAASAFVKAAVRDSKAYIAQRIDRPMYVGYATYDGDIRDQLAQYFNCGDQSDAIDFWGYNVYSWCGDSSYTASNYDERVDFFRDYSVPTFFAEYGCNDVEPRQFTDVPTLFGNQMTPVFSGGIVYMYFQEDNNYGLVEVDGNTVSTLADFDNLSSQMAKVTPSSTSWNDDDTSTLTATSCPSVDASWSATPTPLPPQPNADLCDCVADTLTCVISDDTDATDYGDIFGFVCGLQDGEFCTGIVANGTSGDYGAYSPCDAKTKLSYVINRYYLAQRQSNPSACAFSGSASTRSAAQPTGTCSSLLAAVGTNGAGTLSTSLSVATTSADFGPNASSSPNASSGSGSGNGNGAGALLVGSGSAWLALYTIAGIATGAAMIVL